MARKKFAKDPMLYIHQPQVERPQAPMQHQYISPSERKESASADVPGTTKINPNPVRKKRNFFTEEFKQDMNVVAKEEDVQSKVITEDEAISKKKETEIKETDQSVREKTKFKDMTIEEKINYLVNSPVHAPDLRCEVRTEKRNYRGVIKDSKDDIVLMRVGKRNSDTEIPITDILAIRMIGF
ncbi:CotO family spore coat protein [Virgibacillus sp. SK37]|uniref:CotO family spore coat protein n=1 Tax=Virgibacillus sp. SK37 TaxID=403957 RepID=UPI0004D0EB11|nr:CotO family spore coat protein [Virgibacillus sp. SK37]AIF45223.1 hypothetical protein X953_05630 [Virgibacillus sp. SK37]